MTSIELLDKYMTATFPWLELEPPLFYNWPVGIRFEIGHSYRAINDPSYFQNVFVRSVLLFQEAFLWNDVVLVVVNTYRCIEPFICYNQGEDVFPKYIKNKFLAGEVSVLEMKKHFEDDGELSGISYRYCLKCKIKDINYKNLLKAISCQDFPEEGPFVSDNVYFINISKNLIFHLYDDRGLDIIACVKDTLLPLYTKYNDWILNYDRDRVNKVFKVGESDRIL